MGWRTTAALGVLALACGATSRNAESDAAGGQSTGPAGGATTASAMAGSAADPARMNAPAVVGGAGGSLSVAMSGGSSSDAGRGGDAGEGGTGGMTTGGACPVWPAVSASAPAELTFNGAKISRAEHDCAWGIGQSVRLPVTSDHTRLLFHYDVNGDGVDDLFVGPNLRNFPDPNDPTKHPTITLLVSKVAGGVLSFEATGCVLAPPLVDGTYALRDLDHDGVTDFVLAVPDGFRVLMNRPSGLELTISYDFPQNDWSKVFLGDVVLGAFESDSTSELAIGFVRQTNNPATTQTGTLLFRDPTHASAEPPTVLATSEQPSNVLETALDPELGIFTGLRGGRALLGARGESVWLYEQGKRDGQLKPGGSFLSFDYLGSLVIAGREQVFAALGDSAWLLDAQDVQQPLTRVPVVFGHPYAYGRSHSDVLLDLDGDGDVDLTEVQGADTPALAVYNGDAQAGLSTPPHEFTPDKFRTPSADDPFLAIGPAKGRLLVSDAVSDNEKNFPLSVAPIVCRN
jgi:hypothetical protein